MKFFVCIALGLAVASAGNVKRGIGYGGDFGGHGGGELESYGGGDLGGHSGGDFGFSKPIGHGKGATSFQNVHLESHGAKAILVKKEYPELSAHVGHGFEGFGGGHGAGLEGYGIESSHGGLESYGGEHGGFGGGLEGHGASLGAHEGGFEGHESFGGAESYGKY